MYIKDNLNKYYKTYLNYKRQLKQSILTDIQ